MTPTRHSILKYGALGFIGLLVAVVLSLSLLDWDLFKAPLARLASAKSGREVTIPGHLRVHLWSWTPAVTIEDLRVANPGWEVPRPLLQLQRLQVQIELGQLFRGHVVLRRIEVDQPDLYLHQQASGRANWTNDNVAPTNPHAPPPKPFVLPAIRELIIRSGRLVLIDDLRRLKVTGTIQADERASEQSPNAFHVQGRGTINQEPFALDVTGGALLAVDPEHPYPFSLRLQAGQNQLEAAGKVLEPFDLGQLDLQVSMRGRDLAELFYLTQLALPNTPPYRIRADIHRDGQHFTLRDISGSLGSSDIGGSLDVDNSHPKPMLTAELTSRHLLLADLGALTGTRASAQGASLDKPAATAAAHSAAARARPSKAAAPAKAAPASAEHLFPDAQLQVDRVRAMNADVRFRATSIDAGKVPFKQVILHARLQDGDLTLDPVQFEMPQGRLSGTIDLDARQRTPAVHIDMRAVNVRLDQLKGSAPDAVAPIGGELQARAVVNGRGTSVHAVMADANGSFAAVIPHGDIRSAFAELTGIDLRGLGLLLTGDDQRAGIRCGVARFGIADGIASAQNIVIDTRDVVITGHGKVNLGTEALDLTIAGEPKKIRLVRLRAPVDIRGQLMKPSFALDTGHLIKQGTIAAALGTLLSPLAVVLAFVDPGLAKDQDCSQLLAQGPHQ